MFVVQDCREVVVEGTVFGEELSSAGHDAEGLSVN